MIRLTSEIEQGLRELLDGGDPAVIAERVRSLPTDQIADLMAALHPADSADVLEELTSEQQREVIDELEPDDAADVLAYLDVEDAAEMVADLPAEQLADILDEMEPDDAADILAELSDAHASATLADMESPADVQALLDYEEESAGSLMTQHVVTLRATATVSQALGLLRQLQLDEEIAYYLFVTDEAGRLVGVVSLRQLVTAELGTQIATIMRPDVISVAADADQEEAARTLARYSLPVLPTVDAEGRLVGVITADDVIDVIQEEATEDLYRLAGLDSDETVDQSVLTTSRQRLTWLLVNLPTAVLASWVVSIFEGTLARVAVLAVFMPIIAGMGGNAGIQTLTLIVRSIALGEISLRDGWRTLGRELVVGLINGVCFGVVVGLLGLIWQGMPILGLVAGIAMLANMIAAAAAGTIVPLLLRRIGADPALASGVIVTTFTDVTGYFSFLGLATLLIAYFVR
ncbi:magnesium transporter [Oscillochloris sp. ZM17-4]|uniref:magnesium transporter n=1 Tax=Oscillochloris sp. ZM17-4 TaxID=2866714 RepID=UPI001C73AEFA|nr:magnesium transporter [Oscillochloris sp. ZM17-4]MBX0326084.1 magnesium transporter [Oscillochloris sp. ZM17-4]